MPVDTINFYDANAATYAADGSVNSRLWAFLVRVRKAGAILELGTGSGNDAKVMLQAGFFVDATDGSRELAAVASNYLGQPVRVMRFEELTAQEKYDGVYAAASLLHIARADLPDIVRAVYSALVPGGVAWASFKAGSAEGLDGLGRFYNYLDLAELRSIWRGAAPWSNMDFEQWSGSGFDNQPTEWVAITATR